jgi:predicted Holliday junction resolvase-like endonuclease|tara:strand:- start:4953 stop:5249 length:297 start_codon:yes stop_codon:yes gene_type:complete
MEFQYFIIFGSITLVVLILTFIIFRLTSSVSDLRYELKLGKINCQKDLDRLEDKINNVLSQSNSSKEYLKDLEKIDSLVKTLNKVLESKIVTDSDTQS